MKLSYSVDKEDFVNHLLFASTLNRKSRWQRKRLWIAAVTVFLAMSWFEYNSGDSFLAGYFALCTAVTLVGMPYFLGWVYKKRYSKLVDRKYQCFCGKKTTLTIDEDYIHASDAPETETVKISQLEHIYSIPRYYFLKLKTGTFLIFPKLKLNDSEAVDSTLRMLACRQDVPFAELPCWKWR